MKYLFNQTLLKDRRRDLRHSQTEYERALWGKLRRKQMYGYKFFRQFSIGPYIVDFYSPKLRLAIEVDGEQHMHHDNIDYDAVRTEFLNAHGIEVIRFWNNEITTNMQGVLEKIGSYCRQ